MLDTHGWALLTKGDTKQGTPYLEKAVAGESTSPTLQYHLGVAYQKQGNPKKALEHLKKALELSPKFPEAAQAQALVKTLEKK